MKVIETLGIKDQVTPKIAFASDGVETMRFVMEGRADLGVSQSSEIVQASPDALAGPFPKELALSTDFSLWHRNAMSPAVKDFVVAAHRPKGPRQIRRRRRPPAAALKRQKIKTRTHLPQRGEVGELFAR
jgi:hypothetical protein